MRYINLRLTYLLTLVQALIYMPALPRTADAYCLSNAMHGQNINLPVCVCVCVRVCVSVTLSVN